MADAEKTLRELLDTVLDERGYKNRETRIEEITSGGGNYTSALFEINVKTLNKELKLFAKVATITSKEMRVLMSADWLYNTENLFYNKLMKVYNNIQKDLDEEHKIIFPEFYGCNSEMGKETIVMENLTESGYKTYNRLKSIDWEHGRVAVENMARFHALSFALNKRDPESFEKIASRMVFTANTQINEGTMEQFKQMIQNAVKHLNNEEHRDIVSKFMSRYDLFDNYNKPLGTPVLVHGDYRLSNMLFKRKGYDLKLKVIDYQTVHAGCPASDLLYFIFLCSDEKFRRLYYDKLVDYYYRSLQQMLVRLAVDPVEVYPRETFESDMKELLPFVIRLAVTTLPMVLVEAELAPKCDSEDANISSIVVEPNVLFVERLRGIINDLVNWGVV